MQAQFQAATRKYYSTNINKLTAKPSTYGVDVTRIDEYADCIEVHIDFRFLAGQQYCCTEFGCHGSFFKRLAFAGLRTLLAELGVNLTRPLALLFEVTVEKGARELIVERMFGKGPSEGQSYQETFRETESV